MSYQQILVTFYQNVYLQCPKPANRQFQFISCASFYNLSVSFKLALYNNSMQQDDQLQFQIHRATSHAQPKKSPFPSVLLACKKLQDQLVEQQLEQAVDDLFNVCRSEYAEGVEGQIFPVQIRKNQQQQLQQFLALLEVKFSRQDLPAKRQEHAQFQLNQQKHIKIIFLQGNQVRDLVLQMYIYLEEHPNPELVIVFIAREITDLSEQNLYCFQKALKGKQFVSVMCTFATFQGEVQSLAHTHYQKYHISLYHPKQLFCKFVYGCVAQPNIKAYLPAGVLTLISDMDYYSISFRQSCRRFVYCLQRTLMLAHRGFEWVDFDGLIGLIEQTISRKFRLYYGYKNSLQKILKVILSEHEAYTISEKAVSLEVAMGAHCTPIIDENDIMQSIRDSLSKHLTSRAEFKLYSHYLSESEEQPQQALRRKKSRFDQLGIDTKKNLTPKNKLENQITRIIKHVTQNIREQAGVIRWQDLKYELRIRPQIPRFIIEALRKGEGTGELVEEVLGEYASPVSRYFSQCDEDDFGRLIYLLKSLEISGLVEVSKKQQRPNVYNNFFEKAFFSGKR